MEKIIAFENVLIVRSWVSSRVGISQTKQKTLGTGGDPPRRDPALIFDPERDRDLAIPGSIPGSIKRAGGTDSNSPNILDVIHSTSGGSKRGSL